MPKTELPDADKRAKELHDTTKNTSWKKSEKMANVNF